MNIKQLEYFVTVVEEGTISAAATKLYMSQPPLSMQINHLESELGCKLFERTSRQIILTEAGKLLYKRSKPLIQMMEVTKNEVIDFEKKNSGTVRIGMISSVSNTDISIMIADYAKEHPGVVLDIYESNTYTLLEHLSEKTIHFGIARTPFVAGTFKQITLAEERIIAVGRKEFFDPGQKEISIKELTDKPLIVYRRWKDIVKEYFESIRLSCNMVCRNDDARTSLLYAEHGLGVALLPLSAVPLQSQDIVTCEIIDNPWKTDIVLLYDDTTYLPNCAKELFSILVNTLKR